MGQGKAGTHGQVYRGKSGEKQQGFIGNRQHHKGKRRHQEEGNTGQQAQQRFARGIAGRNKQPVVTGLVYQFVYEQGSGQAEPDCRGIAYPQHQGKGVYEVVQVVGRKYGYRIQPWTPYLDGIEQGRKDKSEDNARPAEFDVGIVFRQKMKYQGSYNGADG